MSLEQKLEENTAVMTKLVSLLEAGVSLGSSTSSDTSSTSKGASSTKKTTTTTKTDKTAKASHTPDELKGLLVKFKGLTDLPAAKALTKKLGYASITEVPEGEIDSAWVAIEKAIAVKEAELAAEADGDSATSDVDDL